MFSAIGKNITWQWRHNLEKVLNFSSRLGKSLNSNKVLEKYLIALYGLKKSLKLTLVYPTSYSVKLERNRKLEHRRNKRYKTEKKFNGVKWKQMVSIKPEATIFYLSFYISNAISVSQTASHTQWLLTFCKVVLLRKEVQHIVRDDQPSLKM